VKNSTLNEIHKAGIEQLQQTENFLRGVLAQFNIVYFDEAVPSLMSRLKARFNNKFNRLQTLEDLEVIRRILQDNPVQRGQPKTTSPSTDQPAGTPSVNLPTSINQSETFNIPLSPECLQPLKKRKVESDPDVEPSDSEDEEAIESVPSGDNNTAGTNTLVIPAVTNSDITPGGIEVNTPTLILEVSKMEQPIQSKSIDQRAEISEPSINQPMTIELAGLDEETDATTGETQVTGKQLSFSQPASNKGGEDQDSSQIAEE
jgi:hypothetical protein